MMPTNATSVDHRLPPLVTIHGINSRGAWQEDLRPVFQPHFRYIPISYPHYRILGGVKVLLEPWVVVLGAGALAAAIIWRARPSAWVIVATSIAIAGVAYLAARFRRRLAFAHVLRQFDPRANQGGTPSTARQEGVMTGERPYLVAHSFGTYLSGRLLLRPTTRCTRLVFAGSVLSREFPRKLVNQRGAGAASAMPFEGLRNEVGSGDVVVKAAGLVRRLVPDLGDAGVRGFAAHQDQVHEVQGADGSCPACGPDASRARALIHNVFITDYTHSDQFITPLHAIQFWLPSLWGIETHEFRDWLELCRVAVLSGEPGVYASAAPKAERSLLERRWSWADGATIEEFVKSDLPAVAPTLDDPVTALRIYRAIWSAVVRACDYAVAHGNEAEKMAWARALDPRMAVRMAAGVVTP